MENCKYKLPCGWCDRTNDVCKLEMTQSEYEPVECAHNWEHKGSLENGYGVFQCKYCGKWIVDLRKESDYGTDLGNR